MKFRMRTMQILLIVAAGPIWAFTAGANTMFAAGRCSGQSWCFFRSG